MKSETDQIQADTESSRVISKGQVTIPKTLRPRLGRTTDAQVAWREDRPGVIELQRVQPPRYLSELEGALGAEWLSDEDDEAYRTL